MKSIISSCIVKTRLASVGLGIILTCTALGGGLSAHAEGTSGESDPDFSSQTISEEGRAPQSPSSTRFTERGVEQDYAVGNGSTLTVVTPKSAREGNSGGSIEPLVSLGGPDAEGKNYYIQFSPTDQRAIKNGGTAALVAIIGVFSPPGGVVAGVIAAAGGDYLDSALCAADGKDLRIYYNLDDTSSTPPRCV